MSSGYIIRRSPLSANDINVLGCHVAGLLHSRVRHAIFSSMENPEPRTHLVRRPRNNRSKVSNGTTLFAPDTTDGRSSAGRRFRDILDEIHSDLGGIDHLSEGQRQLCRRAVTLSMTAEGMEAHAVTGQPFDVDLYGQLTDRLGRCFQRLGLERVAHDVTPRLEDYLQARAKVEGEAE
jgi:hypothetical protein